MANKTIEGGVGVMEKASVESVNMVQRVAEVNLESLIDSSKLDSLKACTVRK